MKKPDSILKEYVRTLSEENLKYLMTRFSQNLAGDRQEVVLFLQNDSNVDYWLASASSVGDFFDMVDSIGDYVKRELIRRGSEKLDDSEQ